MVAKLKSTVISCDYQELYFSDNLSIYKKTNTVNKFYTLIFLPTLFWTIGSFQSINAQSEISYKWGESIALDAYNDVHLPVPIHVDERGNYLAIQPLRENNQIVIVK